MSKADGVSQPQRSQNPSREPGVVPQRSGGASYDSEQFPVLIRLPDLTASPKSRVQTPPASVEPPDVDDGGPELQAPGADHAPAPKRTRNRRTAADRDTVPRRYTVRGILALLPSQALVMLVLAAVTALVYLMVQGVDPGQDAQQAPAGTHVAQTSTGESETNSDDPQLWPVSSRSETSNEPPGPEPVARAQDTPPDTIPPPMLAPSFDAPSGAVPTENGTEQTADRAADRAAVSNGPLLSWQGEPPAEAANFKPVEPVQGWPPEMGTSSDSTPSPRPVAPYDRAAYSPANSSPWPVSQKDRQQSDENAVQSATLNGTIDLSQPRVDYDRTRSGIH